MVLDGHIDNVTFVDLMKIANATDLIQWSSVLLSVTRSYGITHSQVSAMFKNFREEREKRKVRTTDRHCRATATN